MADNPVDNVFPATFSLATPEIISGLQEGQVVASDVGATIPGITLENLKTFIQDLFAAVIGGSLASDTVGVALAAAGLGKKDKEAREKLDAEGLAQEVAKEQRVDRELVDMLWLAWTMVHVDPGKALARDLDAAPMQISALDRRILDLAKDLLDQKWITKRPVFETLDAETFEELGLVPKADLYRKKEIRINTKLFYTQHKFNLMREEPEGYAKLVTSLNLKGTAALSEESAESMVKEVRALIGRFDLDPNRVVDFVIGAFEQQPDNRAFLKLMPQFGSEALTHVLGFRFQQARMDKQQTPSGLYLVAAHMVSAGLVRLEKLLGHLGPDDETVTALQTAGRNDLIKASRMAGSNSLNAMSADQDEGRQRPGLQRPELDVRHLEPAAFAKLIDNNQQLGMVEAFLLLDEWRYGRTLISHLGALGVDVALVPGIGAALCQGIAKLVEPLFQGLYPNGMYGPSVLKNLAVQPPPVLPDQLLEMLSLLGPRLYHDLALFTKLARVVAAILNHPGVETTHTALWENAEEVLVTNLMAGMLLVPSNPAVVAEVWGILSGLPDTTRYRHYNALRALQQEDPVLRAAGHLSDKELKKVMRRLHKPEDKHDKKAAVKPFARLVAKIAHCSPITAAATFLHQAEAYSAMIDPVAEALCYLTPMGFDVLGFVIIDRLTSTGRAKIKEDGINFSDWLQYLASFTANVCRKYEHMDIRAICQYVANQLKAQDSVDLLVLKDLITTLTGVSLLADVSEEQVDAMAGGPSLQEFYTHFSQPRERKRAQRGMNRLMHALQQGPPEQRLALPLIILIAQQRARIPFITDSPHLKLIADIYDKCHETLSQYIEFLNRAMTVEEYAALLPSMETLANEYKLDPEIIFQLYRRLIKDVQPPVAGATKASPGRADAVEDGQMEEVEDGEAPGRAPGPPPESGSAEDGEISRPPGSSGAVVSSAGAGPSAGLHSPGGTGRAVEARRPLPITWDALCTHVTAIVPPAVWKSMDHTFYILFWSLSLQDVYVPEERYKQGNERLDKVLKGKREAIRNAKAQMDQIARMASVAQAWDPRRGGPPPEIPPPPMIDIPVAEKEYEYLIRLKDQNTFDKELKRQRVTAAATDALLKRTHRMFFDNNDTYHNIVANMMQQCVLPRMLNSAADAMYVFKLIQWLHRNNTPGFPTVLFVDRVMTSMSNILFCATDNEARNFGIFFHELSIQLEAWRADEKTYSAECSNKQGFKAVWPRGSNRAATGDLTYVQYANVALIWQNKIYKVFATCLQSAEYVQIRNALLVLNRIAKAYPKVDMYADRLQTLVANIKETDARQDLRTLAAMYHATLTAEKRIPGRMLTTEVFKKLPPANPPPTPPSEAPLSAAGPPPEREAENGRAGDMEAGELPSSRPALPKQDREGALPKKDKEAGLPKEERPKKSRAEAEREARGLGGNGENGEKGRGAEEEAAAKLPSKHDAIPGPRATAVKADANGEQHAGGEAGAKNGVKPTANGGKKLSPHAKPFVPKSAEEGKEGAAVDRGLKRQRSDHEAPASRDGGGAAGQTTIGGEKENGTREKDKGSRTAQKPEKSEKLRSAREGAGVEPEATSPPLKRQKTDGQEEAPPGPRIISLTRKRTTDDVEHDGGTPRASARERKDLAAGASRAARDADVTRRDGDVNRRDADVTRRDGDASRAVRDADVTWRDGTADRDRKYAKGGAREIDGAREDRDRGESRGGTAGILRAREGDAAGDRGRDVREPTTRVNGRERETRESARTERYRESEASRDGDRGRKDRRDAEAATTTPRDAKRKREEDGENEWAKMRRKDQEQEQVEALRQAALRANLALAAAKNPPPRSGITSPPAGESIPKPVADGAVVVAAPPKVAEKAGDTVTESSGLSGKEKKAKKKKEGKKEKKEKKEKKDKSKDKEKEDKKEEKKEKEDKERERVEKKEREKEEKKEKEREEKKEKEKVEKQDKEREEKKEKEEKEKVEKKEREKEEKKEKEREESKDKAALKDERKASLRSKPVVEQEKEREKEDRSGEKGKGNSTARAKAVEEKALGKRTSALRQLEEDEPVKKKRITDRLGPRVE